MGYGGVLAVSALAVAGLMLTTWVVSVTVRNASIVDIVWGLGFVLVAWAVLAVADGNPARQWLLVALTTVWGLRLSVYLFWRNAGKDEDHRYQALRRRRPESFWIVSLWMVFGLQGLLMWIVSLPVQLGQVPDSPGVGVVAWLGVALWAVGLFFEAVGDWQLARFRADPANHGQVMDRGLWAWTRHPNYFGDFCVWWGIFLVAAETGVGLLAIVGPVVMSILLIRVSGKDLLERSMRSRRPGYRAYVERTSGFLPRPPRRSPA